MDEDYRRFLRDRLPRGRQGALASALGRSESWMSQVLRDSTKDRLSLPPDTVPVVARFLGLDDAETEYLQALVDREEAASPAARERANLVIAAYRRRVPRDGSERVVSVLDQGWHVGAILELARCEGFRPDAAWIARTLNPAISIDRAEQALELLHSSGLLGPTGLVDRSSQAADFGTSLDVPHAQAEPTRAYQREVFGLAREAGSRFRANERHLGVGCVALSDERYEEVRERFRKVMHELVTELAHDPEPPSRVYKFCVAIFPASDFSDVANDTTG